MPKPPVTRLMVIKGECNGDFELVTDFSTLDEFDRIYREWFDHPETKMWCVESLIIYIKSKQPERICLLKEDYDNISKGKVIPATKQEWEAENN